MAAADVVDGFVLDSQVKIKGLKMSKSQRTKRFLLASALAQSLIVLLICAILILIIILWPFAIDFLVVLRIGSLIGQ